MKTIFFIIFLFSLHKISAQDVLPLNNSLLYTIQVLFEIPIQKDIVTYEIMLSEREGDFKNSIFSIKTNSNLYIDTTHLEFGKQYFWMYKCYNKNGNELYRSEILIFKTNAADIANERRYLHKIEKYEPNKFYNSNIIFDNGTIINRNGKRIWTVKNDSIYLGMRNLQMTPNGTLTFGNGKLNYEIDLQGNVIWQTKLEFDTFHLTNYHHDFKKLENGNYLCLAEKRMPENDKRIFNQIFEITKDNKIMWLIDEEKYFGFDSTFTKSHINSVATDNSRKNIYVSCRDLNSIFKINNKTKEIVLTIGEFKFKNIPNFKLDIFNRQHSVNVLNDTTIILFNNNSKNKYTYNSSVQVITVPNNIKVKPTLKWEYIFNFSDSSENKNNREGDADLLPNGNFLITSGGFNRVFEITPKKEIVWSSLNFDKNPGADTFRISTYYRSSFINSIYPNYFSVGGWIDNKILKIAINNFCLDSNLFSISIIGNEKNSSKIENFKIPPFTTKIIHIKIHLTNNQFIEIKNLKSNVVKTIFL